MTPIDKQEVVCMNRDALYSVTVFDLEAAPVTIVLPDPTSTSCPCRTYPRGDADAVGGALSALTRISMKRLRPGAAAYCIYTTAILVAGTAWQ